MNSVPPGSQQYQMFEKKVTKTVSCDYLLFLPEDYSKKRQLWPLMLFLHGAGERGSDLEKVKVHGPPKIVENRKDFPFILVSPQCPEGDWWTEKVEVLINLVDDIVARYEVDKKRIYLTGLSMGGYGTWALASAYPDRFAAIAPICGEGSRIMSLKLKDIPIWVFHGAKDEVVPLKESEEMVNAIRNSGGDVKFTIYPNAGHDSWTESYNNPKLYDWFLEHSKPLGKK
ncbi:MAG: prolyl oligopeptidase family serine peptidase [Desulfobacteraceae bacterium]|nr:MAG: prolyl oligopeptidase family serine peptidase [Desulfobacteraceae bacterium]